MTLTHSIHTDFAQVEHLQGQWNDLARRTGDLMASYEWCETWWRHFRQGRQLEIHVLRDGGQLVGVLPLMRETLAAAAGLRVLKVLGNDYTIDAVGLAIEPDHAGAFLAQVLDSLDDRGRWDALYLGQLRSYIDTVEPLARAAAGHRRVQRVILGLCDDWSTLFDLPETYERYLQSLDGTQRRDTLRRERNLREGRDVRVRSVCAPEEVPAGMDALIELHQQTWTDRGQPGHFGGHASVRAFHRELAGRLVRTGQLVLLAATADGQVVSTGYGYQFGPRTHMMFTGYRVDGPWRRFGLGRLLLCWEIRQAIERGSRQIEDARGIFEYKLRMNGHLVPERSLWIVRQGRDTLGRFRVGLWTAYLLHAAYGRIWQDRLAVKLRAHRPAWHCYIRSYYLAKLCKRMRSGLSGGPILWETGRGASPPPA